MTDRPAVLFRAEITKSRKKRVVPLKPELAELLRAKFAEAKATSGTKGFIFSPFPSDDALFSDLEKAGIERKDAAGHIVHFHAMRKTFQTWGAASGMGMRSAQEFLGHSDPKLTANVYTDVAGLDLHGEVSKLPWVHDTQIDTQKRVCEGSFGRFRSVLTELVALAQKAVSEVETEQNIPPSLGCPTWIRTMTR